MAKITDYTTDGKVLNALGLTSNEVTSDMINGQDLALSLLVDLTDWYPGHTALQTKIDQGTATAEEEFKGQVLQMFALWYCAATVVMLWLAIPQRISDGKADMRRFPDLNLEKLAQYAASQRDKYKSMLLNLEDPSRTTGYSQMGLASPAFDPVTGEST